MVEFTKDKFVSWSFESCHYCIVPFYLWMSKTRVDIFVTIVQFLNVQWEPCHITIGFFEIVDTTGSVMALQVHDVLAKHGLITQVIAYVKNKGSNLSTMTIALTSVILCQALGLTTPFVGACHVQMLSICH
jgi:hypothetical protein